MSGRVTELKDANSLITYFTEGHHKREIYRAWQSTALAVRPSEQEYLDLEIYSIPGEKVEGDEGAKGEGGEYEGSGTGPADGAIDAVPADK